MKQLFRYNWQVRDEWFKALKEVSKEELFKSRIGGQGSIALTLYHIIEVEYAWINWDILDKKEPYFNFDDYKDLYDLKKFSIDCGKSVKEFVKNWEPKFENEKIQTLDEDENTEYFLKGEILRHIIAHEIHHIGQISIWARELGIKPPTANLIRRGLFSS